MKPKVSKLLRDMNIQLNSGHSIHPSDDLHQELKKVIYENTFPCDKCDGTGRIINQKPYTSMPCSRCAGFGSIFKY